MSQQKNLEISERVRAFRQRSKLSQEELGNRLGVSGNYIYLIESGKKEPGPSLLKLFESLEESPLYHSEIKEADAQVPKSDSASPYSWMEIATLDRMLADLSQRLLKATANDRKHILGNIAGVVDELEQREISSKGDVGAATGRLLKKVSGEVAGDVLK